MAEALPAVAVVPEGGPGSLPVLPVACPSEGGVVSLCGEVLRAEAWYVLRAQCGGPVLGRACWLWAVGFEIPAVSLVAAAPLGRRSRAALITLILWMQRIAESLKDHQAANIWKE